jgi:hypothetical protein
MIKLSKEKQNRIILMAGGTAAICAALWFFVIDAQNGSLAQTNESIREVQDKINKAEIRIKRKTLVKSELAALRLEIGEIESGMIPAEQLNGKKWVLDTLNNFIKSKHDVTLTSLSSEPLVGKQFLLLPRFAYSAAVYDVEVRAFYHAFGKFLADFENSFPYISIQKLQMSPLATPSAATGPASDLPEEFMTGVEREQLRIAMKVVVLFKPPDTP